MTAHRSLLRSSALLATATAAILAAGCGESSSEEPTTSAGGAAPAVSTVSAPEAPGGVGVFPVAGTPTASPQTQISVRGPAPEDIGELTVTGSKSGAHPGKMEAHSDGRGASFLPDEPFDKQGEDVTVKTGLDVPGAKDGSYGFTVVARPKAGLQSDPTAIDPKLLKALTGQTGKVVQGDPTFKSRKDLRPPKITIFKKSDQTAPGSIFLSPKIVFGAKRPNVQNGPLIIDDAGRPIWFAASGASTRAGNSNRINDFRVQEYKGKPVLTYWQGRQVLGTGEGVVRIVDNTYETIKTVRGGNGYQLDFHEARLTPQGTLLGLVYNPVSLDLSEVGGPEKGRAVDAVVQEIDIETGLVLFEWHSLSDVKLKDSYTEVPEDAKSLFDYVHVNSASLTNDGNIIASGRDTWAGYKLNRRTGELMETIGGKTSDYKMLGTAQFAYQHDIEMEEDGSLRIYDNQSAPKVRDETRGLTLTLDEEKKTAKVQTEYVHAPKPLLSGTQGSVQRLENGNMFMEWGSQGYFSEFTEDGKMIYDGRIARGQDSYRGYRHEWVGTPRSKPDATVVASSAYASWNGATEVAEWKLLTGASKDSVEKEIGSAKARSFETRITVKGAGKFVAMQAVDADGEVLGTSRAVRAKKK